MTQFDDRLRESGAYIMLRSAEELLADLKDRDWQQGTDTEVLIKLEAVVKNVIARMTIADRNLVAAQTLRELDYRSAEFLRHIQFLDSHPDFEQPNLDAAVTWADELLVASSSLPAVPLQDSSGVLEGILTGFDLDVRRKTASLEENLREIRSQTSEVQNSLRHSSTRFDQLQKDFDRRLAEQLRQTNNKADAILNKTQTTVETMNRGITGMHETFRDSQGKRQSEFAEMVDLHSGIFANRVEPIVSDMEKLREQATNTLEAVTGANTAKHYSDSRDEQKTSANRWRKIGLWSLVGLVLASIAVFVETSLITDEVSILSIFGRSGLLISLSALATYALRQSGHHRRREDDISRVANELLLLWPFMSRLPEEDRKTLMKDITPLYFKGGLATHDPGGDVGLAGRVAGAIPTPPKNRRAD